MWNCNATVKIYLLAVGWRPAFKFYSMWLSLVGAVVCIFVMFIISWPTALITMAVIAVLFFYVHYRKPGLSLPLPVFAQVLFSPVFVCYSAPDRGVEYCDERVCLSSSIMSSRLIFTKFFVHVTHGRRSVLLWRLSDMLHTFSFMDDVIFAHNLRLLDVAARLRQRGSLAALGLACRNRRCRLRTLGTTSCSQGLLGRSGRVEYIWHHVCIQCPCVYSDKKMTCA